MLTHYHYTILWRESVWHVEMSTAAYSILIKYANSTDFHEDSKSNDLSGAKAPQCNERRDFKSIILRRTEALIIMYN